MQLFSTEHRTTAFMMRACIAKSVSCITL